MKKKLNYNKDYSHIWNCVFFTSILYSNSTKLLCNLIVRHLSSTVPFPPVYSRVCLGQQNEDKKKKGEKKRDAKLPPPLFQTGDRKITWVGVGTKKKKNCTFLLFSRSFEIFMGKQLTWIFMGEKGIFWAPMKKDVTGRTNKIFF